MRSSKKKKWLKVLPVLLAVLAGCGAKDRLLASTPAPSGVCRARASAYNVRRRSHELPSIVDADQGWLCFAEVDMGHACVMSASDCAEACRRYGCVLSRDEQSCDCA